MTFLTAWISEFWFILVESGVWLVGGFLLAGVVHVLLPRDLIARAMAGRGSLLRAALIGVPLPLCSCSVIPVAAGLRARGASRGASAAFAISTPESGADSIAYTYAVLGPVMAVARPLAALVTALGAGALIAVTTTEENPATDTDRAAAREEPTAASCCGSAPPPAPSGCCSAPQGEPGAHDTPAGHGAACAHASTEDTDESSSSACGCGSPPRPAAAGWAGRAAEAVRYGWIDMPRDLGPWLVAGLALSALIGVLMPEDFLAERVGTGLGPMLLMLAAGMPVYVCATASTPVAAALVAKGLSPGAALVFLLAGPATNMATMAWVAKDLGWRALASYLTAIAVCSVAFGVALDALITRGVLGDMTTAFATMASDHEHGTGLFETVFGALLALMLLVGLLPRWARRG